MKTQTITIKLPILAARFFYTVLAYFLNPDGPLEIDLSSNDQSVLAEVFDELAIQLSTLEG